MSKRKRFNPRARPRTRATEDLWALLGEDVFQSTRAFEDARDITAASSISFADGFQSTRASEDARDAAYVAAEQRIFGVSIHARVRGRARPGGELENDLKLEFQSTRASEDARDQHSPRPQRRDQRVSIHARVRGRARRGVRRS